MKTGGVYTRETGDVPSPDVLRKQKKHMSLIREKIKVERSVQTQRHVLSCRVRHL